MPFYDPQNFDLNDGINQSIWKTPIRASMNGIAALCPGQTLTWSQGLAGTLPGGGPRMGAFQILIPQPAAPGIAGVDFRWVPDLVGRHAMNSLESIYILGSDYAPFITPAGKGWCPAQAAALENAGMSAFQTAYLNGAAPTAIVRQWAKQYYDPIRELVVETFKQQAAVQGRTEPCCASHMILGDVCRASIGALCGINPEPWAGVCQGQKAQSAKIYAEYAMANASWTLQRVMTSKFRRIVCLGTTAEHGLLLALHLNGFKSQIKSVNANLTLGPGSNTFVPPPDCLASWPREYARGSKFKLKDWIPNQAYWDCCHPTTGRVVRVLPILHPSRQSKQGLKAAAVHLSGM